MANNSEKFHNVFDDPNRDEYYTPYDFIQDEVDRYASQLEGKVVYCPCDNPRWSNFVRYFVENFDKLNLKALICSYYEGSEEKSGTHVCWAIHRKDSDIPDVIYQIVDNENGWSFISNEAKSVRKTMLSNGWNISDNIEIGYAKKDALRQCVDNGELFVTEKGSFNSAEARFFASKSDVIITNPPFSKFVLFMDFLLESGCKFLVIGSNIAINLNNVFSAWKKGDVHGGYSCNQAVEFVRPDGSIKGVPVTWYTNMEIISDCCDVKTGKENDGTYSTYDDRRDVIYLKSYKDYPDDYYGMVAIPPTSFNKFNHQFFDVIDDVKYTGKIDGKFVQSRLVVKRKHYKEEVSVNDIVEYNKIDKVAPAQSNGRGYVYIFADEHDRIKIGVTINPAQERLNQLQTGNADELSVLFVSNPVFGYEEVEQKVHDAMNDYHIRLEWFNNKCFAKAVKMITEMTAPSKQDVKRFRNI